MWVHVGRARFCGEGSLADCLWSCCALAKPAPKTPARFWSFSSGRLRSPYNRPVAPGSTGPSPEPKVYVYVPFSLPTLRSETGRIRFGRARFQTPSLVSFSALFELREENSVSSSQPTICVPKRFHRVFFAELTGKFAPKLSEVQ